MKRLVIPAAIALFAAGCDTEDPSLVVVDND
jgi:hypothetical protein